MTLIVSILGARDQWGDTKRLLEYGFDNYQTLETQPAGKTSTSEQVNIRTDRISASLVTPLEDTKSKSSDDYLLQVGSFRERDRADSLVKQFSADGFEAFVESIRYWRPDDLSGTCRTVSGAAGSAGNSPGDFSKSGLRVLIIPAPAPPEIPDNPSSFLRF